MSKIELTSITWNEAIQQQKEQKKEDEIKEKEYEESVTRAVQHITECMASDNFRPEFDFEDACCLFGVDEEDLINRF